VRTSRYRLVEWKRPGAAPDTAEIELYDYQTDPGETRNVATEEPSLVAKLRALLTAQGEAVPQVR
jgi:iduronate 2-sulfatase